jgi:hypothetical protein
VGPLRPPLLAQPSGGQASLAALAGLPGAFSTGLDQTVRRIEGRAADLIGVEQINIELLQIVLYKQGQRFGLHHDAGTYDENTKG